MSESKGRLMGLVDNLGRYVGACRTARPAGEWVEYGYRAANGVLHVAGLGRVRPLSRIPGAPTRREILRDRWESAQEPGQRVWEA